MLNDILKHYNSTNYDFRLHACPNDPSADSFEDWVDNYRMKWSISRTIKPAMILEIGIGYGYSARAFLEGYPKARLIGFDTDKQTHDGQTSAVDWAVHSLAKQFNVTIHKENIQSRDGLSEELFDLIHINGKKDADLLFNDLDFSLVHGSHILVDAYHLTKINFLAVNEWLWLNKAAIVAAIMIPGYVGDLLIRTKVTGRSVISANSSLSLSATYTTDYYLNDCGGYQQWRQSKGKSMDPRLQAVADVGMALSPHRSVVDLGAGRGELSRFFAMQGSNVTAIDYSKASVELLRKTFDDIPDANVNVVCDSVLNPNSYDEDYDLAVASDIVEHLSEEEDYLLYEIISRKLEKNKGTLVIHTAPNLWYYLYEHPRQQKAAKKAGLWLPRIRRTWYERVMHINEQNPRGLKKKLSQYFPYVTIWFVDHQSMGASLLRDFRIEDMRRSTSIFAAASHRPIERAKLEDAFCMKPLKSHEVERITLRIAERPTAIYKEAIFTVNTILTNNTNSRLCSLMPNPIHLSYHWLNEKNRIIEYDGLRTVLNPPLYKYSQASYPVKIKAPNLVGRFVLRILPVQEMVRWHDADNDTSDITITIHE